MLLTLNGYTSFELTFYHWQYQSDDLINLVVLLFFLPLLLVFSQGNNVGHAQKLLVCYY
jgi:hypothetical protein